MTALLADNIKLGEINLAAALKYIKAGKLKALGVTNPTRLDQIPDMKTASEQGVDIVYAVERGVVAPKGTSKEIINHYASMFKGAAADKGFKDTMHKKVKTIVWRIIFFLFIRKTLAIYIFGKLKLDSLLFV